MRCDRCDAAIIEVDHYGERLAGRLDATLGSKPVSQSYLWNWALILLGKLLLNPLPCSRSEMPATILPAAMKFLRPFE